MFLFSVSLLFNFNKIQCEPVVIKTSWFCCDEQLTNHTKVAIAHKKNIRYKYFFYQILRIRMRCVLIKFYNNSGSLISHFAGYYTIPHFAKFVFRHINRDEKKNLTKAHFNWCGVSPTIFFSWWSHRFIHFVSRFNLLSISAQPNCDDRKAKNKVTTIILQTLEQQWTWNFLFLSLLHSSVQRENCHSWVRNFPTWSSDVANPLVEAGEQHFMAQLDVIVVAK